MFGSQEELERHIPNQMIINLIGSNHLHESIISSCLDINEGPYIGRIRVVSLLNPDQLSSKSSSPNKDSLGLLNLNWLKKTTSQRPATVILVYDVRNKAENISWKDYENSIYIDINKVKKMDNYNYVNILILLFTNSSSFGFDNFNEDKERSYNIKRAVDNKNIFIINGLEGLKSTCRKLTSHLMNLTITYYRNLKRNLKIKRNNSNETKEKMIKYNLKLGVVSQIKNRKRSTKYFEEAYTLITSLDIKNYFYGSRNYKFNFSEIKAVADWLFYKIFYLKSQDLNTNLQSIVLTFNSHMNNYSKLEFFNTTDGIVRKFDLVILIEYYWRVTRYEFMAKFLEEKEKFEFYSKNVLNFPGYHYLVSYL